MIKLTKTYVDFDGNERTEDAHFNLTRTELVDMAMDLPDNIQEMFKNNPNTNENEVLGAMKELGNKKIFDFIKSLVLNAYGIKSEDGRRFEKSEKIREEFSQTLIYDAIITDLTTNDEAAIKFVSAVIPAEAASKMPSLNGGQTTN